jgi:hypothetical protein
VQGVEELRQRRDITAADWFTASTSFANPAVTIARCLTDTFARIRPVDAPAFIAAELLCRAARVRERLNRVVPEDWTEGR